MLRMMRRSRERCGDGQDVLKVKLQKERFQNAKIWKISPGAHPCSMISTEMPPVKCESHLH